MELSHRTQPPALAPKDLELELSRPEAYSAIVSTRQVSIERTHASRVFLLERDVFKIKKAVDLGFLDFRRIEQRRAACDAEVRLNARLSPDIYRGVVPVCLREDGHLAIGGHGVVVDWAVHMVRLDDRKRSDHRLAEGSLTREDVRRIAYRIADFHAGAPLPEPETTCGLRSVVERNVKENFDQTRDVPEDALSAEDRAAIIRFQLGFLEQNEALFEERVRAARVRDGHGDLRLEHVYVGDSGEVTIVDCIEFNDRFRYADVAADVAFFSMDLAAHGRRDLAEMFLASYARASDDYDLYALIDFYESYRAFVRGKVSAMTARGLGEADAASLRAWAAASRYFTHAATAPRRDERPVVIGVGGLIGAGKSTVADRLAELLACPVIDADRTRKAMLGVSAGDSLRVPPWQGPYDPSFTARVYGELFRRARLVLASGRSVVVDASFRTKAMRQGLRDLAHEFGAEFRFALCRVDLDVCRERLARRERETSVSDGRLAIFDDFRRHFEDVDELAAPELVTVDTGGSIERLDDVLGGLLAPVSSKPRAPSSS